MFLTIKERYLDSGIDWTASPQPEECRVNYDCKQFICWVADSPLCCALIKTCRMQTVSSSSQPHSFSYPTFMFNLGRNQLPHQGTATYNLHPILRSGTNHDLSFTVRSEFVWISRLKSMPKPPKPISKLLSLLYSRRLYLRFFEAQTGKSKMLGGRSTV
jgi:hypothetical protein